TSCTTRTRTAGRSGLHRERARVSGRSATRKVRAARARCVARSSQSRGPCGMARPGHLCGRPAAPTQERFMDTTRDAPSPLERGHAALARGAWEDAIADLSAAVGAEPRDAAAWEALGMAFTAVADADRA